MFELPKLNYSYDALQPTISADIMELHHTKHHQSYVDKLNAAVESVPELKGKTVEELLRLLAENKLPDSVKGAIRNHGGGHYNHSLFWLLMSPNGGGQPSGELADKLAEKYGSFDKFVEEFNAKALGVFGSGWAWLQPDLTIITTANQDNPLGQGLPEPILGLDVWEHAYYLDYKNKRDDYIKNWWNVVDWGFVSQRYGK